MGNVKFHLGTPPSINAIIVQSGIVSVGVPALIGIDTGFGTARSQKHIKKSGEVKGSRRKKRRRDLLDRKSLCILVYNGKALLRTRNPPLLGLLLQTTTR